MTTSGRHLSIDEPVPHVRRLTLNRPEKRNALDDPLRSAIFEALRAADVAADVHVTVIHGGGPCFSAGYDLPADLSADRPCSTAGGDGSWPRHVVVGYPPVRLMSSPDMQFRPWLAGMRHAMELMLTGDAVNGVEAARIGLVYRAEIKKNLGRALEERDRPFGDYRGRTEDAGA